MLCHHCKSSEQKERPGYGHQSRRKKAPRQYACIILRQNWWPENGRCLEAIFNHRGPTHAPRACTHRGHPWACTLRGPKNTKTVSQGTLESGPGAPKRGGPGSHRTKTGFGAFKYINSLSIPRLSGRAFRSRSPQKVHRTNWVLNSENGVSLEESHRTFQRNFVLWSFRSRSHQKIIFSTYIFLKESVQICPVVVWGVRWSWSRKIGLSGGCSVGLLERNTHFLNSDKFLGWIF